MIIDVPYEFGEPVYLKTDVEQLERLITEIRVSQGNVLVFILSCGTQNTPHYEYEFDKEIDVLKRYDANS